MTGPSAPPVGWIGPGLRRVLAPNPSPMTGPGTNTYLLGPGDGAVAVIDPGPDDAAHLAAILGALGPGERIVHILVTHSHRDHSGLAAALSAATGAEVLGFGPDTAGRSPAMARLAAAGPIGGGEGLHPGYRPDRRLADGEAVEVAGAVLRALHTPGHLGNHLCFLWQDRCFTGDLVLGWTSSLISPPDGDLDDYLASLARLAGTGVRVGLAGHGADIPDLGPRIAALAAHRRRRDDEIRAALAERPATAPDLVARVYAGLAPELATAAARNVLSHLISLESRGLAACTGPLSATAVFALTGCPDGTRPRR
ncbi:MBL fold metallo-hydrolase [Frigidibacter sp. MR17.24]|uniref:MBL fold metallo-hydrolase n=1 Tax=Frigidibacter sp. MR17.24 TaxID=3127345 RepID=UPI003012B687